MAIGDAVPFGKSAEAHDADTVYEGGQGFRLYGIDSQEVSRKGVQYRDQPAPSSEADKATKYLANIMANEQVSYEDMGEDAYGRRVVRLRGEDGRDINEELVREAGAGLMSFGNETSPYTGARAEYQNKIFSGQEQVEPGRVFHEEDYAPTRSVTQELGTGFERGSKMLGAMVGKAVEVLGDTTGVDSVSAKGREVAQKYLMEAAVPSLRPQVDSYKDVEDFRSGMNYVAGILGEQAPQLAADASAAAVGALTGAGVGAVPAVAARRGAMSAALRMVAGESAAQGAKRGAMVSMFAQNLGESAMELEAEGIDDRKAAIAAAFAKMGADYAGTLAMFRTAKRMAFDGNKVTSRVMMHEAAKSIGWEGGTEGLQTIIDKAAVAYHKDGYDILSDDNMEEIVNSMIAGAVVGGTVSGVSGGGRMSIDRLLGGEQKAAPATEETAPVEEAAPVVEEAPAAPSFEEPVPAAEEAPAAPVSEGYSPGTFDVSQLAFEEPVAERPVVAEAAVAAKAAEEVAPVDEPVSRDYNFGQNNEGDTVDDRAPEFTPRSEAHKRFQQGVDKLARGEESVDAAFGVDRTETEVVDEKPVTAQATAPSAKIDLYEGAVPFGEQADETADITQLEGDSVVQAETRKKRTIADAVIKGMEVAENMKQKYRLARYKDDDVSVGTADQQDVSRFEKERGVGSQRKMDAGFVPTDSYMKRRMVRVKFPGSDEWHNVDFRTMLEEVYNSRDIDTTEEDPLPHRRVLNQLSYMVGELADAGIEIQAYDADGRPVEGVVDPANTILWTPAKGLRDVYKAREGSELTLEDIHGHEMESASGDEKRASRYRKIPVAETFDREEALAADIDGLAETMAFAKESPKDPDAAYELRRAIRRVGGVAESKDVAGLLVEARHAQTQAKNRLSKMEMSRDLETGGEIQGDASDVYDGLALDAISKKQSGKDFFAEASASTKAKKKKDSGATQPEPKAEVPTEQVSFSLKSPSEISAAARSAVESIIKASGLKSKVVVTTDVSTDTRKRGAPASIRFEGGKAIIELNMAEIKDMTANKQDVVSTLVAHELGHAWMQEKGLRIPQQVLSDLHEAYRKARAASPAGHVYRKQKGVGFDEWFADQFMTYVLRKSKPTGTATQKYFNKVWKGISKVINALGKALFNTDRFAESETGQEFVSSVFRTAVNETGMTSNKYDRILADAYEELFGSKAASRVGGGERRAQTEARAVGDADTMKRIGDLEREISRSKTKRDNFLKDGKTTEAQNYQKRIDTMQTELESISATEPRDFYARAFYQKYGGVAGAKRLMGGAVKIAQDAGRLTAPVWATSIRRLKQLGHHALGASYEKYFTDVTAEMRLWMAQMDKVSDKDFEALGRGVKTPALTKFLEDFYTHLKRDDGMPTLGKISKDYVPRMFDRQAIENDTAGFKEYLIREAKKNASYDMTDKEAKQIVETLLKDDSAYYQLDSSGGASFAGNAASRSLNFLNDLDLQSSPWVIQDKRTMMAGYVHSMLKRATYERHFGGYKEVLSSDEKSVTQLRHHMQNIPFRAHDLGIDTGERSRTATQFEKKRVLEKATTRQILDMAASAAARGWIKVDAKPSEKGQGLNVTYSVYEPSFVQNEILRSYRTEGKEDKSKEFVRIADALSGRLGADAMSPQVRKASGVIMTYENILTLLFATLSSFPDLVGPIVRSRDFAGVVDAMKGMAQVIGNNVDARERRKLLHDFGVAHRTVTEQALLEVYGAQYMSGTAQKVNDAFFKYTGLEAVTSFGRTMAASVAMRFIQRHGKLAVEGNAESVRYLKELGLTPEEANSANGAFVSYAQHVADGTTDTEEGKRAEKILFAVNQFVDESVVRPDASQRPVWASDPRFMLVWHLKSFAYSYAKVIMKPVFKEAMYQYQKHGISPRVAVPLLAFALPVMLASALGLRLREFIQYDLPHAAGLDELERPSADRDLGAYLYDVIRRGGILGPAELAVNAMEAEDKKRSALVTLLGPTADHLNALLQFDAYKAATRSVPVLSQMPEFKMWLYDEMH